MENYDLRVQFPELLSTLCLGGLFGELWEEQKSISQLLHSELKELSLINPIIKPHSYVPPMIGCLLSGPSGFCLYWQVSDRGEITIISPLNFYHRHPQGALSGLFCLQSHCTKDDASEFQEDFNKADLDQLTHILWTSLNQRTQNIEWPSNSFCPHHSLKDGKKIQKKTALNIGSMAKPAPS
jgi:hypothetical protein